MRLFINEVEAVWFTVNVATLILTLFALWDAWVARGIVKRLNGHAREIAAAGNVRREFIRLVVQVLFLSVVIPGLFTDQPAVWSPPVIALVAVPGLLLVSSAIDTIDRRRLLGTVELAMQTERDKAIGRIEAKVDRAAAIVLDDRSATADALVAADRIETIGKDTNDRAKDIQGRLP